MDEPPFPLAPPKWDESEAAIARQFFATPVGQKMLQVLRHYEPVVIAPDSDNRRTQHEQLQGYKLCWRELFRLLAPKTQ